MEMFNALLLPVQPQAPSIPLGPLEINYDAILPASRRPLARSLPACRKAMGNIKDDLQAWRDRSDRTLDRVAGEVGRNGLEGEMRREVLLVAVTPTQQEMRSSIGREVRHCPRLVESVPLSKMADCSLYRSGSVPYTLFTISRCSAQSRYMSW